MINYDEAKVPAYVLPDPLVMQDARAVSSAAMWRELRRPEILQLFCTQVYGRRLPTPEGLRFDVTEDTPAALQGQAIRKRIRVDFP